uniref:Uncharacterized protein n=1 Tax=Ixodes ricinus TaxID=34613 RepID=A0A6B0UNP0_IXORI
MLHSADAGRVLPVGVLLGEGALASRTAQFLADGVRVLQCSCAAVEEGAPQHGLQVAQALVVDDGEGAEALYLLPPLQALLKVLGHLRQGSLGLKNTVVDVVDGAPVRNAEGPHKAGSLLA